MCGIVDIGIGDGTGSSVLRLREPRGVTYAVHVVDVTIGIVPLGYLCYIISNILQRSVKKEKKVKERKKPEKQEKLEEKSEEGKEPKYKEMTLDDFIDVMKIIAKE